MTTDQWDKYVDRASEAINEFWLPNRGLGSEPTETDDALARKVLRVVGPLIAEDTRARMVAAAARAVDREGAADPRAEIISRLTARRSEITPGRPGWGYLTEAIDMVNEVFGAREAS